MLINIAGLMLIGFIVWWFWLAGSEWLVAGKNGILATSNKIKEFIFNFLRNPKI